MEKSGGRWLAGAVLVVGLLLGALATRYVQQTVEQAARARFNREAEDAVQEVAMRMEAYLATIRSGAALFAATDEVTREEFRYFVQALDLRQNYPGIQGLGFSAWLELGPHLPGWSVKELVEPYEPYPPSPGGRQSAIVMLEPLDRRNIAALGFDMYSEPVRRRAMDRARDTGEPAATGRVELVQEITADRQPGFLIYVPVYAGHDPAPTEAERRQQLEGWVYAPFRMGDLLHGIFGPRIPFDLAIYTGGDQESGELLFRYEDRRFPDGPSVVQRLEVAGQPWTFVLRGYRGPTGSEALLPPVVLIASLLVSLLLLGITWSLVRGREAAEAASARLLASETERSRLLDAERLARREAETARLRAAFLADASALMATNLSAPDMLERLARRAIPFLGRGCAIDLFDRQGQLRREVVVYDDPEKEAFIRAAYADAELSAAFAPTIHQVATTGEAVLLPEVPDAFIDERVPAHLREAARGLLRSFVLVPLPSREGILGTLSFSAEEPHHFGPSDLELAADLGRRLALAVENRRLFADSQEAIRIRDDFLSIASHELRTPLTALQAHLQGMLRRVRREPLQPDEMPQLEMRLDTALRQTRRLGKLVNELLDVSRITSGRLQLEPEPFDLSELALELAERFREEAHRVGSELVVEAAPGATGRWDRNGIEQVLTNLLSNAIKYGAGQPVELVVDATAERAGLEVRDQGIGIPAEAQARIFDRFERASSDRHYGGLGLGLYITREIVAAHGGSISVSSEAGRGAIFRVELPRDGAL